MITKQLCYGDTEIGQTCLGTRKKECFINISNDDFNNDDS